MGDKRFKRYSLFIFTAALFSIAKIWKQPKYPLMDEWIKKNKKTYNGTLFRHKKEGNPDICDNMGEC